MQQVLTLLEKELALIQRQDDILEHLEAKYRSKVARILDKTPFETHFRPAVVLLLGRILGTDKNLLLSLATMVQFLFLGIRTHRDIVEENSKKEAEENRLRVLIGDYYYGRFFKLGAIEGLYDCLTPLTQVVVAYTEDTTVKSKSFPWLERTDLMLAEASRMAARLADASAAQEQKYYNIGAQFGIAYESIVNGETTGQVCLQGLAAELKKLPESAERDALYVLIDHIGDHSR